MARRITTISKKRKKGGIDMIRVVPKIVHCDKCSNNIEYEENDKSYYTEDTTIWHTKTFCTPRKIKVFYIECPVCKNIIEIERGEAEGLPFYK